MSIQIKLAQSPKELDQVLQLRYQVFAEEEGYYPTKADKRILDKYDILPTNANFLALQQGKPIGTVRFTQCSEVGLPSDSYFDYQPHLPYWDEKIVSGGMFCICKKHRGNHRILLGMLWMGFYWALKQQATHILAPINPVVKTIFRRMNFKVVAEKVFDKKSGLATLPMALKLSEAKDAFIQFVQSQEMLPYLENFKREIYEAKEFIIHRGEIGQEAFVIVKGEVHIINGDKVIAKLGAGEMFGEVALLTGAPRTADVIAATPVDLMVLDREDFQKRILKDPAQSLRLINMLGGRLKDVLSARNGH